MTHTPPTQAELDAWKIRARDSAPGTSEVFFRLIAEVERLRGELNQCSSSNTKLCALDIDNQGKIARLTKEVEELRKDKERLQRAVGFFASVIKSGESWTAYCDAMLNSAMQQKGEE
jgi:hypothetical protein